MQAAFKHDLVSVEDYLAGEQAGELKHEYVGGAVCAMAGASREHNENQEYLIVAQDRTEATLFRRANNWRPEVFTSPGQTIPLASIDLDLPLAAIYEGVIPPK